MSPTQEQIKLTDEQVEAKLKELQSKEQVTPEEKEELQTLKEERQTRYQKRIDRLSSEKKAEAEKARQLEEQLKEEKSKREELEKKSTPRPELTNELVDIGGTKYYTDETLTEMVNSGELNATQAYAHQQKRIKAEIKAEIYAEQEEKGKKEKVQREFEEDRKKVLEEYPEFAPSNPNHNPEDPLYKLASELWVEAYQTNPRGLSISIKRAKQILRMNDKRPDVSEDLSVGTGRGTTRTSSETTVQLSEEEKESAVRMYVMGNVINPATGRVYTDSEAVAKAIKAKQGRMRR